MKFVFFFLTFFVLFASPVFAQRQILPNEIPFTYPSGYNVPGYCIVKQEVLAPSDDIYICTGLNTFVYTPSQTQTTDYLYNNCWQSHANMINAFGAGASGGILLKKQVFISFTLPPTYETPCILKSASEPDDLCTQPLDINGIVRSAFGQRFPLDLFEGFQPASPGLSCPIVTITGQSFQLCYLKDLVASLKYVFLIVFIISSVIAL